MLNRSTVVLLCSLAASNPTHNALSSPAPDQKPEAGEYSKEEFFPEKEPLDDVRDALELADRELAPVVEDFRTRFAAMRVVQEEGSWRIYYAARRRLNKDRSREAFVSRHFTVVIEIATGKVSMSR
jgi:hypothetical protein